MTTTGGLTDFTTVMVGLRYTPCCAPTGASWLRRAAFERRDQVARRGLLLVMVRNRAKKGIEPSMTSRERLCAALNHIPADRPALDIGGSYATGINTAAYRNLKRHLQFDMPTEMASKRSDIARLEDEVRIRMGIDTYPLLTGAPDGGIPNCPMAATGTNGTSSAAGRKEATIT